MVKVLDMAILETQSLGKSFGALTAVKDVSLAIAAGSLHSIIGPNGAGKTTLFNLLTGTFPPTTGRIVYDGKDITGTRAHRIAHLGMARSFQRTNIFPAFSLFDNVWVAAFATARSWKGLIYRKAAAYPEATERARQALSDVGLLSKADVPARAISHGEQRQLELAIALAAAPRVLLLDEPAAGLNPAEREALHQALAALAARGVTLVVVEHDMRFVGALCERVVVLNFGCKITECAADALHADPRVREAYLGTETDAA